MGAFDTINITVTGAANRQKASSTYKTIVLKPNIVVSKNVLTQGMVNSKNTKYVIKWNYDFDGKTITLPKGCILSFEGGSITNGTLSGGGIILTETGTSAAYSGVTLMGTWKVDPFNTKADEEDLTVEDGEIKLKNKSYNTSAFSGLGRIYLKKNIQDIFTENTLCIYEEPTTLTKFLLFGYNEHIFVAYNENDNKALTVNDSNTGVEETDIQDIRILEDVAEMTHFMSFTSESLQLESGESILISDINRSIADRQLEYYEDLYGTKNLLTQEMLSQSNTVYHIQYDYSTNEDITVPSNCTLLFEGGSITGLTNDLNFTGDSTLLMGDVRLNNVVRNGVWRQTEKVRELESRIAALEAIIDSSAG